MTRKKPAAPAHVVPPSLQVVEMPIGDIREYPNNPRVHSIEQIELIARSMKEFGWTNPCLIDADSELIAGHGRLSAGRLLGLTTIPCIRLGHLTPAQKRALVIADNKIAIAGAEWDLALLRTELGALALEGFDLGLTGFEGDELAGLLMASPVGLTDPNDVPPTPEEPVTQLGDVWLLGWHRLVCGDCTVPVVSLNALGGAKPHLMVTDPPYGVSYDADWRNRSLRADGTPSGGRAVGKVTNDETVDWRAAWALFPGSVAYVWHAGMFADVVTTSLKACRFRVRAQIVWVKQRHVISRGHYHAQHEPVLYAVREGEPEEWNFVPEHELTAYAVREGSPGEWQGSRKQSTVWFIDHVKSDTGHSTQKPVLCMQRPIENNSKPGQAIYEPFSGSGTTIMAGEITGRCVLAIELSPAYVDVAITRWQNYTGREATLEATGETFAAVAAARAATAVVA